MFDLQTAPAPAPAFASAAPPVPTATPWLALMLDEIDYGMLLLADGSTVLHANHAARSELDASHPLQLLGNELRVAQPQDLLPLLEALTQARERGLRRFVNLGHGEHRVSVAVVPLAAVVGDASPPLTLLVFGKRQVCSGGCRQCMLGARRRKKPRGSGALGPRGGWLASALSLSRRVAARRW